MGITLLNREFLYENRNGSDFSIDTGNTTTIWKGNVIDRVKETTTFSVSIEAVVTEFDSNQFEIVAFNGTRRKVTRLSGSFIVDGFLPGDIIDLTDESGTPSIKIADAVVDTVTDLFLIVVSTDTLAVFEDASIRVKQDLTELNFTFTTNGQGSVLEQDSITEAIQQFKNNGVGLDPGGGRVTTFSTSNPRFPNRWLTQLTDGYKIRFIQNIDDYTQEFEYEHIFTVTHYFEEGQKSNLDNLNSPNPFKNSTLQYITFFDIGSAENAGSLRRLEIDVVGSDSVGWLNENFDGGENNYTLTSVLYERVSDSEVVTEIEVTEATKVTAVITATNVTFLTTDAVTVAHSLLPPTAIYRNNLGNYNGIWLQENLRTAIDAGSSSGTIINNLVVTLDSATQITVEFEIKFTINQQKQLRNTDLYLLAIVLEDSTTSNNTSNRVTLKIDNNIYAKNSDIPGLVVFDSAEYYGHLNDFEAGVTTGFSNLALANEDGFLSTYRFHIVTNTIEQIRIEEMFAITVGFNTVTEKFFRIQTVSIPVPTGNLGKTGGFLRHIINLDSTRDFNLADQDQFNQMIIESDNFSSPDQFYNVFIAQKVDWQDYLPLDGVDPDFLDTNEPNDGLNRKTSRYSGAFDHVIRAGLIVNVSSQGVNTLYLHFSGDSTVRDYDDSSFTALLESFDVSDVSLEGKLLQFEDNKFKVTYDNGTTKVNLSSFQSIERIQKEFQPGFNNFELSTFRNAVPNTVLEGPTTPLLGDKSIESGDFVETGTVKGSFLQLENYTLSARIFETFSNGFSVRFDGIDEYVDCGSNSSLDLERTDSFSFSAWVNMDLLSTINTIFTKQRFAITPRGYNFQIQTTGKIRFALSNNGITNGILIESTPTLSTGSWHHVAVTYDGSSLASGVNFYIDGSAVAKDVAVADTLSATIIIPTVNLNIGARDGSNNFMDGFIDEPAIFFTELTSGEVLEIFNSDLPNNLANHSQGGTLISWWRMGDGDTFPILFDNVGVNNGTMTNMEAGDIIANTPP